MPQSGTETTIESIDEGFQVKMVEMLKQTGRNEIVVGWYHSHPGFGCWLSQTDINTQKTFEQQVPRTVAVVVDPIQSVRGKVVIDAFRTYGNSGLNFGESSTSSSCPAPSSPPSTRSGRPASPTRPSTGTRSRTSSRGAGCSAGEGPGPSPAE